MADEMSLILAIKATEGFRKSNFNGLEGFKTKFIQLNLREKVVYSVVVVLKPDNSRNGRHRR